MATPDVTPTPRKVRRASIAAPEPDEEAMSAISLSAKDVFSRRRSVAVVQGTKGGEASNGATPLEQRMKARRMSTASIGQDADRGDRAPLSQSPAGARFRGEPDSASKADDFQVAQASQAHLKDFREEVQRAIEEEIAALQKAVVDEALKRPVADADGIVPTLSERFAPFFRTAGGSLAVGVEDAGKDLQEGMKEVARQQVKQSKSAALQKLDRSRVAGNVQLKNLETTMEAEKQQLVSAMAEVGDALTAKRRLDELKKQVAEAEERGGAAEQRAQEALEAKARAEAALQKAAEEHAAETEELQADRIALCACARARPRASLQAPACAPPTHASDF